MSLTTICPKHGKQLAVGNWDECEACLIEDKSEQMELLYKEERRRTWGKGRFEELYGKGSYKQVLDTVSTGEF